MGPGFFIFFNNSLGGVKKAMRDRPVYRECETAIIKELQKEDWIDVEIKEQLRQHHIEYFDIPTFLDKEIKECQDVIKRKRRRKKAIDMILRSL